MRIIAFAGPKGSGKDTAAKYLLARSSLLRADLFVQVNFADQLKYICTLLFGFTSAEMADPALKEKVIDRWPFQSPRAILQNFAHLCRTMYDPSIWVKAWERKVVNMTVGCLVVTDLRHQEELDVLKSLGAKIIYVNNPKVEKIRSDGIAADDPLWSDPSEAQTGVMKASADYVIQNDGESIMKLHQEVHKAVMSLMGDWKDWQELTTIDGGVNL